MEYIQPLPTRASSQGIGHSPEDRPSPRAPLSCAECSRRKIRCDKKIPCRACFERGEGHNCRRQQAQKSRPRSAQRVARRRRAQQYDVYEELDRVRERLDAVEALIGITRGRSSAATDNTDDGRQLKENGLVSAMEEAALGIGENRRWQGASLVVDNIQLPTTDHPWFSPTSLSLCLATLPQRELSEFLVASYCDNINAICGSLHRPSLERQHKNFWTLYEQDQPPDGMHLALLFAVLSNAAFFLDEQQAWEQGLDPERLQQFARQWFNCSIATFFRCGGISHNSLAACQTILSLRYAFHLTGNSSTHQQLAYVGIGIARAMNLHLLGKNESSSEEGSLMRDLGRRCWWLLVEGDWDLLPYHRYCFISPPHFNTALPDITDEGTLACSTDTAHSLTFLLTCCQSSKILHEVYGPLTSNQYPLYDVVISASKRLDQVVQRLPKEVHQAAESSQMTSGPAYVWRFLLMMMAYRSYIIHRSFFVKSLSDPRYEATRLACVQAAETIISLANKGLPAVFYRLWNTTLWLVAAGLVMGVDLVHAATEKKIYPDIAARRRRLSALVDLLQDSADRSGIGERGARLIKHICAMEHEAHSGSSSDLKLTRDDIFNMVRQSNTRESVDASKIRRQEPTNPAWDVPSRRQGAPLQPPSKEISASMPFATPAAEESTEMDFGFSESNFFMPQWGDGGSYGPLGGPGTGQNHLDALFADILPNPPT
ncbi:hypothetical protein NLU13_3345 [Sarocladium strictum]|uniref:Zn(2)-C6 fungal-type domain-containing protein n=1 Tax=Sarocladium strictum TaxID=5046 RepID=A0AA39GPK1_SARSR|nr:hypothetical protein NLU13_3345 [Sarocladium strictum]